MIDLRSLPCLVVGGGKVALRKVRSLLEFGGQVTVVSPRLCRELAALAAQGKISVLKRPYSTECIKYNKIVFSATDNPKINKAVSEDCTRKGILLNAADNPALCDFIMPAILRRGYLTVSVSSQGKAPFYTREVKKKLDEAISPATGDVSELAAEFRKHLLSGGNGLSQKKKEIAYKKFLQTDWDRILRGPGKRQSKRVIKEILKELQHV